MLRKMVIGITAAGLLAGAAPAATLVHDYEFNGSGVTDSVGGVNGTLEGDAAVTGGALVLDGAGDYAQLSGKLFPTTGAFSLYFRYAAAPGVQHYYTEIVSQGYSGQPGFYVGFIGTDTRVTDIYANGIAATLPADNGYHGLLLTTGAGTTNVYIDGNSVFSAAGNVNPGNQLGDDTRFGTQFGNYNEYLTGSIDAVRVFSGIASYAQASSPTPEPTSWAMMIGGFGMIGGTLRRARGRLRFA